MRLRIDGTVLCWGDNYGGELGTGHTTDTPTLTPNPVPGVTEARGIAVGTWNSCARPADDSLVCWGTGRQGALGDGQRDEPYAGKAKFPVLMPGPLP